MVIPNFSRLKVQYLIASVIVLLTISAIAVAGFQKNDTKQKKIADSPKPTASPTATPTAAPSPTLGYFPNSSFHIHHIETLE
jgi:hypothetical protein